MGDIEAATVAFCTTDAHGSRTIAPGSLTGVQVSSLAFPRLSRRSVLIVFRFAVHEDVCLHPDHRKVRPDWNQP